MLAQLLGILRAFSGLHLVRIRFSHFDTAVVKPSNCEPPWDIIALTRSAAIDAESIGPMCFD
jgi:hypothetical protein